MLTVTEAAVSYGASRAVDAVSLEVADGEVTAVLGSNGAGKSSLGQGIAGLVPMQAASRVVVQDLDVSSLSSEERVKAGIVYVPEGRRVFANMSVEDNLRAGAFVRRRKGNWAERLEEVFERVPRLEERRAISAGLLSGGEQQLLAICRALMSAPRVLILDEPSLGLAPVAIQEVTQFLTDVCSREALSILVLEQNISFASKLAHRGWIMQLGVMTAELTRGDLQDPEKVRGALVG